MNIFRHAVAAPSSRLVGLALIGLIAAAACAGPSAEDPDTATTPTETSPDPGTPDTPAQPTTPRELRTVAVADQGALTNLPIHVADAQGFLADEGLQLERVSIRGFGEVAAALINEDVDVALHLPLMLTTVASSGAPASYFANVQSPDMNLVASPEIDVPRAGPGNWQETLRATAGHTIGVPVVGGTFDRIPMRYMADADMDPENDVDFVATGAGQAALSALQIGQVQFIVADSLASVQAEVRDVGNIVLTAADLPGELNDTIWVGALALRERLDAEPEFFSGIARALQRATEFISDPGNGGALAQVIIEYHEVDDDTAMSLVDHLQSFQVNPRLTADMWEATTRMWIQEGLGMEEPVPSFDEAIVRFE